MPTTYSWPLDLVSTSTRWATADTIINRAAKEVGLAAVADPFASTDANFVQLCGLLTSVGQDLVRAFDWPHLQREHTIATDGSASYALPGDFRAMVEQTGWDRTADARMLPVGAQRWQHAQATEEAFTVSVLFRLRQNTVEIYPVPAAGKTLAFEYRTRLWVQSAAASAPDKDEPTLSTDRIVFDQLLAVRALKVAFLQAKGFDTSAALADYQRTFDSCTGDLVDAPTLSLSGASIARLIDADNLPESGFGQ